LRQCREADEENIDTPDDKADLLRPILRRMRQRPLVILNPSEIAGIKPPAALVAAEIVFSLGQSRTGHLPTDDGATWHRFVKARNLHLMFRSKNQAHPPAAIEFYIVTVIGAVKRPPAPLILRCSTSWQYVGALDVRHCACQIGNPQWCLAGRRQGSSAGDSDEKAIRKSD
jgi:hypothetical protein